MNVTVFNTGETVAELKEKYNPDGSILRRAQLRMLDMLLYLDSVCKDQGILYRIDAGNVLGAVRHGGFIPWDDDVDIVLPRKDAKKLCKYLVAHPHPQYKLQSFKTDYGYVGAWYVLRDTKSEYIQDSVVHNARKYRGLQVDIFPYENRVIKLFYRLSANISRLNSKFFVGKHMRVARVVYMVQFNLLHPLFRAVGYIFGNPGIYMHSYGALFSVQHSEKALFPLKPIVFEGYTLWGPADPDLYCIEHYGPDYMKLPPVGSRNHHQATYIIED